MSWKWLVTSRARQYFPEGSPERIRACKRFSELMKGEDSPLKKYVRTEEDRRRLSERMKGTKLSEETKRKLGERSKERWSDPEYREKRRQAMLGHHVSEETKRKISEANRGRSMSPEAIEKSRQAKIGKKLSEETKGKMSIAHTNPSPEYRAKLSAARKGKKFTQEHIDKIQAKRRGIFKHSEETKELYRQQNARTDYLKECKVCGEKFFGGKSARFCCSECREEFKRENERQISSSS